MAQRSRDFEESRSRSRSPARAASRSRSRSPIRPESPAPSTASHTFRVIVPEVPPPPPPHADTSSAQEQPVAPHMVPPSAIPAGLNLSREQRCRWSILHLRECPSNGCCTRAIIRYLEARVDALEDRLNAVSSRQQQQQTAAQHRSPAPRRGRGRGRRAPPNRQSSASSAPPSRPSSSSSTQRSDSTRAVEARAPATTEVDHSARYWTRQ